MAGPGTYQHWLPQAYLRGFIATRGMLERYGLVGKYGNEVVFVAALPDLCSGVPEQKSLVWYPRPIDSIGGCYGLHSHPKVDELFDGETTSPFSQAMSKVYEHAERASDITEFRPSEARLTPEESQALFLLPALHSIRGPMPVVSDTFGIILWCLQYPRRRAMLLSAIRKVSPEATRCFNAVMDAFEEMRRNGLPYEEAEERACLLAMCLVSGLRVVPDFLAPRDKQAIVVNSAENEEKLLGLALKRLPDPDRLFIVRQPSNQPLITCDTPFHAGSDTESGDMAVSVPLGRGLWLTSEPPGPRRVLDTLRAFPASSFARWLISPVPVLGPISLDVVVLYKHKNGRDKSTSREEFLWLSSRQVQAMNYMKPQPHWVEWASVAFQGQLCPELQRRA